MDKTVSILIANRNSFQAVELAVESIKKYTKYPHKVIVFDDASTNKVDVEYLRKAKAKGLIHEFIEGDYHRYHGAVLNILLHEICDTKYAAILDCDVQIKDYNWLADLVELASKDPKIIGIFDFKPARFDRDSYRTGFYMIWFGLLNMTAYTDNMQVDWRVSKEDRNKDPYKSIFAPMSDHPKEENFDENIAVNDPGSNLWIQVKYDNPEGYKVVNVPAGIYAKFHHFGHISCISMSLPGEAAQIKINREIRFTKIRIELEKLRCAA